MKLVYITNTDLHESSGGGSGVNFATHDFLDNAFKLEATLVIKPKPDHLSKLKSVLFKKAGLKRNYHSFSERRLNDISNQFMKFEQSHNLPDFYFFHGFTQWIKTKPGKPYFCFNDACFHTYVSIYNNSAEFLSKDLQRIFEQEKDWLDSAQQVFFRSEWALEETKKAYGLSGRNFLNVGVGGFIEVPDEDVFDGKLNFLFIAREFIPKGGLEVVKAFKALREVYPNITLSIIGEDPGNAISAMKGIDYLGFFNKQVEVERKRLFEVFSKTFALVHPTIKDINPLVLVELSYFGCPAISSRKFAIPEYIIEHETGFLIDDPKDVEEIQSLMEKMITLNIDSYNSMRTLARRNAITNNTWKAVGERIINEVKNQLRS